MAKIININDGQGTGSLINGSYTVTATSTGYDNTTINPSSVSIVEGTNTYQFTGGTQQTKDFIVEVKTNGQEAEDVDFNISLNCYQISN